MLYDKNWLQRLFAWVRQRLTFSASATVLLTIFNVVVHGPRHLLLHLGLFVARSPVLRGCVVVLVGPLALLLAGMFGWIWLTYQPTTRADLVSVDGTVAHYGYDDQDRFLIGLKEYDNTFVTHAEIKTFDTKHFMREVQLGDAVHFLTRKTEQSKLNNGELLVVYEIRSNNVTYVGLGPALAAEHHDRTVVLPWTAAIFGTIGVLCVSIFWWDSRRNYA